MLTRVRKKGSDFSCFSVLLQNQPSNGLFWRGDPRAFRLALPRRGDHQACCRQQRSHANQVVRPPRPIVNIHPTPGARPRCRHLRSKRHALDPAENLLDPFPLSLAHHEPAVPGGARVDGWLGRWYADSHAASRPSRRTPVTKSRSSNPLSPPTVLGCPPRTARSKSNAVSRSLSDSPPSPSRPIARPVAILAQHVPMCTSWNACAAWITTIRYFRHPDSSCWQWVSFNNISPRLPRAGLRRIRLLLKTFIASPPPSTRSIRR